MRLIDKKVSLNELKNMSNRVFGGLVKAVIDIKKEIMVVDASMHADEENFLLQNGSQQNDLWGINLYPEMDDNNFIEFDSMINVRPNLNNLSRNILNKGLREKITSIVNRLIIK